MPVCAQVRGPAVASRTSHRSLLAVVPEFRRRVPSDGLQDLPAGESTADGDEQGVHLPAAAPGFSKRGWDPNPRAEHPDRKARARGTGRLTETDAYIVFVHL